MKIGVSSYSFSQYLRAGKLDLPGVIEKAAELGFDDIEFTDITPPEGIDVLDYATQLRAKADECGLEVSAHVVYADLAQPDEASLLAEVERVKKLVDVAHALGAKFFRHDVMHNYNVFRSFDQALPTIAKGARMITEYAETKGIRTMTENHGFICQDSDRVERLMNAVNHPNYGLLADIGNFLCVDEMPHLALSKLANFAFMVHAKDFKVIDFVSASETAGFQTRGCNRLMGVAVGQGRVRVALCFAILKRAGFDGYADVEYEGTGDCIDGLKQSLKCLRGIIG